MPTTKINDIILQCHPSSESFCAALANSQAKKQKNSHLIDLSSLQFNPVIEADELKRGTSLDELILKHEALITKSRSLTIVAPLWWGTLPAKAWGFLQKVLRVESAYTQVQDESGSYQMKGLLTELTINLLITADLAMPENHPLFQTFREDICPFIGAKAGIMRGIGPMRGSSFKERQAWLKLSLEK